MHKTAFTNRYDRLDGRHRDSNPERIGSRCETSPTRHRDPRQATGELSRWHPTWVVLAVAMVALGLSGCGKKDKQQAKDGSQPAACCPVDSPATQAAAPQPQPQVQTPAPPAENPNAKYADLPMALTLKLGSRSSMDFVLIPPGAFTMGSPTDEPNRRGDEVQHHVTISKPFYMGVMVVTWAQYEDIISYPPNTFWLAKDPPLETVTWEEAVRFCEAMSEKFNRTVRLPTEAEWEYACRAGTITAFSSGPELSTEQANYAGAYDERTSPASGFQPNAWGLHGMHGNVWEWCSDYYGAYPAGAVTDPKGPESGETRILRGGSWFSEDSTQLRSAFRQWQEPDYRYGDVGFRVVVEVE